jgi:hypothetical protein
VRFFETNQEIQLDTKITKQKEFAVEARRGEVNRVIPVLELPNLGKNDAQENHTVAGGPFLLRAHFHDA